MKPKGPSELDAEKWDAIYKELEAYHKKHGHSNVPSTLKTTLSQWVGHQRRNRRNEEVRMTAERIAQLDKVDFRWATPRKLTAKNQRMWDEKWREMYEKLKAYNEKHGHCKVPIETNAKDPDQSVLGLWVTKQRSTGDRMPQSRKDLLDELGFLWVADNWDTMYEQLVKFRQEHSHTEVPRKKNASLAEWCLKQRGKMRQNKLPPDRRGRMEEIGFDFELQSEKNERIWNSKLERLKKYKRKHGNCLVPSKNALNHVEDAELSIWVTHQRTGYKRGTIPSHRITKLEEVGFVWSIVERGSQAPSEKQELAWEKSYEKLREFYEVHGHFSVTAVENGKTNPFKSWIGMQRKFYGQGQLRKDRRLKLEAIDFIWDQGLEHHSQRKWNASFQDLTRFREEKGHTFVRRGDGMELWRWTKKMIWKHKRSTLSTEREQRLESIGFWDPPPTRYDERGEDNEKSEEDDKDYSSSEDDDNRKPTAKRHRTTSVSEEDEEDFLSRKDEDDRKPTAKRRRSSSSSEEEDEEFRSSKHLDDFIHKTTAKRRRATSTSQKEPSAKGDDAAKLMPKRRRTTSSSEDDEEGFLSSKDDDDRKPKAKRYRSTSTCKKELSKEREEDPRIAKGDDEPKLMAKRRQTTSSSEDEDEELWSSNSDRKRAAKQRRITSAPEEENEEFWSGKDGYSRKPMRKGRPSTSAYEEEDEEEFRSSEDDDDRKPKAKLRRATSADATDEYEEEGRISRSLLTRYSAGTKVKKFFGGYGWFLGEIASIDEEYCCYVRYEDGDEENYLLDELEDLDNIVANVARTHPRK
jgi:hypothetical protein